jgi:hypothetical protein
MKTTDFIQYFPVRSEADPGCSRGTDRRLVRESLGAFAQVPKVSRLRLQ